MKRFSAQYIITGTGDTLKRGIITTDDTGLILDVVDTGGKLTETPSTQFFNGVIVPGFVNCHCHLELSAMRGSTKRGTGLAEFIREVRDNRPVSSSEAIAAAIGADREMKASGTVACMDICNSDLTFAVKDKSMVSYVNMLEIFGIDPAKAGKRISEIKELAASASRHDAPYYITPHSAYSLSLTLFEQLKPMIAGNEISSIHFMESPGEIEFLHNGTGAISDSYSAMGIVPEMVSKRVESHTGAIVKYLPEQGNLVLVHNTFAREEDIIALSDRENIYWCLCPASNLYIENALPPVEMLRKNGAEIVIGTDSLASNDSLLQINELKILQSHFQGLTLQELVRWASTNGARAIQRDRELGSIRPGMKPGLVLIENLDLLNLRLTPETVSRRLI